MFPDISKDIGDDISSVIFDRFSIFSWRGIKSRKIGRIAGGSRKGIKVK